MGDFEGAVSDGVKAGATGAAIAGTAAAIGAAAGASLGPFAVIAAPIGAAVGALIGFFVSLAGGPSKEEKARAAAAAEAARIETANKSWALAYAAKTLTTSVSLSLTGTGRTGDPVKDVEHDIMRKGGAADALRAVEQKNPAYTPMIEALFNGLRVAAKQKDVKTRMLALKQMKSLVSIFNAFASTPSDISADPFAYLRPPLSEMFGPALKAAGIDIADPKIIAAMRGNYDLSVAADAAPRKGLTALPIRRRSVGIASGGKIAVDGRAFSPKIAPNGVGSFKLFPESVPPGADWMKGDDTRGQPLSAAWPYGLDADNFAKPPGALGISTKTKVVAAAGVAGIAAYVLFFL